jgi:hypothetical protein
VKLDPGTVDVIELVVALVVKIALGLRIVGWDEKRLARTKPEWLERAWPPASRLSAIVVFQEIGVFWHFVRTRWSAKGLALGLAIATAYVVLASVVLEGVDLLLRPEG